jgi:Poxvirus A32 protein
MPFDCRLSSPFNMLVAGPSKSGKTTFVSNLLKVGEDMFVNYPDYVILYYANAQPLYEELYNMKLVNEMINFNDTEPSYQDFLEKVEPYKNGNGSLIIFDDTLSDIKPGFEKIFQVLGHHTKCSLIYISQNLFYNSKTFRNLSLQLDYIVMMRNQRDASQIRSLAFQLCPGNSDYIINAYREATKEPYSYMFIDCNANSLPQLRLRSNIFPHEAPYTVFLEK